MDPVYNGAADIFLTMAGLSEPLVEYIITHQGTILALAIEVVIWSVLLNLVLWSVDRLLKLVIYCTIKIRASLRPLLKLAFSSAWYTLAFPVGLLDSLFRSVTRWYRYPAIKVDVSKIGSGVEAPEERPQVVAEDTQDNLPRQEMALVARSYEPVIKRPDGVSVILVKTKGENKTRLGTAFRVKGGDSGTAMLLTAGHVVHEVRDAIAREAPLYLASVDDNGSVNACVLNDTDTSNILRTFNDSKSDIGALIVKSPVVCSLGLKAISKFGPVQADPRGAYVLVYRDGEWLRSPITNLSQDTTVFPGIKYLNNTEPGDSGAPIYAGYGSNRRLVGIHLGALPGADRNYGLDLGPMTAPLQRREYGASSTVSSLMYQEDSEYFDDDDDVRVAAKTPFGGVVHRTPNGYFYERIPSRSTNIDWFDEVEREVDFWDRDDFDQEANSSSISNFSSGSKPLEFVGPTAARRRKRGFGAGRLEAATM